MIQLSAIAPATDDRARCPTAGFRWLCDSGAFDDLEVALIDGKLERRPQPQNEHGRGEPLMGRSTYRAITLQ